MLSQSENLGRDYNRKRLLYFFPIRYLRRDPGAAPATGLLARMLQNYLALRLKLPIVSSLFIAPLDAYH